MRAIQFMFYNSSLVLKEVPKITLNKAIPSLKSKYLIKVHYSPINPSDLGFIAGVYGRYQDGIFPKTAGFEGSGIIEDAETEEGRKLIGKKVAFFSNYENQ
jgi:NADPH:quinone reductase-like Zn-dependent oxidoreductase